MKCLEIVVETNPNYGSDNYYLLHQNEYSFVTEVLSCSYHPKECTCDTTVINYAGKLKIINLILISWNLLKLLNYL